MLISNKSLAPFRGDHTWRILLVSLGMTIASSHAEAAASRYVISLKTGNGHYVVAENQGGGAVNANRIVEGDWERFTLRDVNGGELRDGDSVTIETADGHFLRAIANGGGPLDAGASQASTWETFTIVKPDEPNGLISNSDKIALRSGNGHYVQAIANGGSGATVHASAIGCAGQFGCSWEVFQLNLADLSELEPSRSYDASPPHHAPGYHDNNNVMHNGGGDPIFTHTLHDAKVMCDSLPACRAIFEVRGYYASNGASYEAGKYYLYDAPVTPTPVGNIVAGVLHTVSSGSPPSAQYERSAPQHAPGYWDHHHVVLNSAGQPSSRNSLATAEAHCSSLPDCRGIFEPRGHYYAGGYGYHPGHFYFFNRISPTPVAPVTAGIVHTKRTLHASEIESLSALYHHRQTAFDSRASVAGATWATGISRRVADLASRLLWTDYFDHIRTERSGDFVSTGTFHGHEVFEMEIDGLTMPYVMNSYGQAPSGGRPLLIMLHGGGEGTPAQNEQNWAGFLTPYQPAGAITVSPRSVAPKWDMWWRPHIDGFLDRLITNMIVFHNVDPNQIYLTGYSAGGDGLYHLGPRMADRWAGALMSAGHPNGAQQHSLHNTCFALAMGIHDTRFNRYQEAVNWSQELQNLQNLHGGFAYRTGFYNTGHGMHGQESAEVDWIMNCNRDSTPGDVLWNLRNHDRFYWLKATRLHPGGLVEVRRTGNTFQVAQSPGDRGLRIRLNDHMIEFDRSVDIANEDGNIVGSCVPSRQIQVIVDTISERGDPRQIFSAECAATPLILRANESIWSPDQRFQLIMQTDGNLVLYQQGVGALWASGTHGTSADRAVMQADGNLVVYGASGALWASGTAGHDSARLELQNDGNLVVYSADGLARWESRTSQP